MSMYKKFFQDIQNVEFFEFDEGFISYRINSDKTCYVGDVYIDPKSRDKGLSYKMQSKVDEHAKECGCTSVYCQADINNPHFESAIVTIIKNGYKVNGWTNQLMEFTKDLT